MGFCNPKFKGLDACLIAEMPRTGGASWTKKVLKLFDRMESASTAEMKTTDAEYQRMMSLYNQSN